MYWRYIKSSPQYSHNEDADYGGPFCDCISWPIAEFDFSHFSYRGVLEIRLDLYYFRVANGVWIQLWNTCRLHRVRNFSNILLALRSIYLKKLNLHYSVYIVNWLGYRLDNFVVGLTNSSTVPIRGSYALCGQYPGPTPDGAYLSLSCDPLTASGRYVIVQQSSTGDGYLTICEIEIYAGQERIREFCYPTKSSY